MKQRRTALTYQTASLRWFVRCGILAAVVASLFGPFTVKFLERMGGTDYHITLLTALPGIMGVLFSLPGALYIIGNQTKSLKRITVDVTLISRLFVLVLLPLVWLSAEVAPMLCVVLLALKSIPESVSQTAFQGLTGDLFHPGERSSAITQRNRYSIPATLLVTLLSGIILRYTPANDQERLNIYQIFFILSALFGIVEVWFLHKIPEPKHVVPGETVRWRSVLTEVLQNQHYRRYVGHSLVFYFAWQMGWPIFNIFQVIHLGADELWLSAIVVVSSLGMFIGYHFWNGFIQRYGNGKTAVWTTLGMSLNPVLMAIFPNLYWVTATNLLIGFFTAGTMTVLLNALLEATPDRYRVAYVGTYNTLVNASLAISPFVSFALLRWVGIYPALYIVCFCRLLGCVTFWLYTKNTTETV